MQTDPFEARRTGAHRLRVVTGAIGAAAVVGTGALTWSLVTDSTSASAGQPSTSTSDDGGTSDDGSTSGNSFNQPSTVPQSSGSGSVHASSGGS
jgi:hypothetical protein